MEVLETFTYKGGPERGGLLLTLEFDKDAGLYFAYLEGDRGKKLLAPARPGRYLVEAYFNEIKASYEAQAVAG